MSLNTFIFDLGGVIIDLDEAATTKALAKVSGKTDKQIREIYLSTDTFHNYEKGLISTTGFRNELKMLLETNINDQILDQSWNAMLGHLSLERLNLLAKLRKNSKVIVLSNTNSIHIGAFNKILRTVSGKDNLTHFADFVFYSHELQMRKPDTGTYAEILKLSKTKAEDALFMDDKKENLIGAESVGICTMHITEPNQILELEKYAG